MSEVLFSFWFFLPAGLANVSPILLSRIPLLKNWDAPLDFGKSFRGKRITGNHKTWRGLVLGTLIGGLTGLLVYAIHPSSINRLELFPLSPQLSFFTLGLILGFGALYGDAVESFFKRQLGIAEGKSWFPFDQIDYIIGGIVASLPVVLLRWYEYVLIVVLWFLTHIVFSYIGYVLKLKKEPI